MKLTKLQLKRLIKEVWQEQLEDPLPEEPLEGTPEEETPEAEPPSEADPNAIRLAEKLKDIADEIASLSIGIRPNNPNAAAVYDLMAESLKTYSDILEQPIENIEDDQETRDTLEGNAQALKQLRKKAWGTFKQTLGIGPGLVSPGR
jgi:hypothetical protein